MPISASSTPQTGKPVFYGFPKPPARMCITLFFPAQLLPQICRLPSLDGLSLKYANDMTTASALPASAPVKTFQVDSLPVRVYASQSELSRDVAGIAQAWLKETIAAKGSAAAILATGNSQIQFLEQLILLGGVDWSRITLFHMDEYLGLAAEHKASFRRYLRERVESP